MAENRGKQPAAPSDAKQGIDITTTIVSNKPTPPKNTMPQKINPPELAALVSGRRTIHKFQQDAPPVDKLKEAIRLAQWAPNHYLTEPWRFYILGRQTIDQIIALNKDLIQADKGTAAARAKTKRWQKMPGWLVITCATTDDPVTQLEDYAACCCAVQNLALVLWNDNIGVKWATGEVIRDPRFYECLHISQHHETVVGLFWYGVAAEIPKMNRKKTTQIITELP